MHVAFDAYYRGEKDIEKVQQIFMDDFKDEEQPKPGKYKMLEATYTKVRGAYLLQSYFDEYEEDEFEVLSVEKVKTMVLSTNVTYVIKPDLVIKTDFGKEVWDKKVTSKGFNTWKTIPNNQMTGYQYVENANRICLDLIGVYKTKPLNECFERKYEAYNTQQIDEWVNETLHVAHQIEQCKATGVWPKNSVQCMWGCAYEPLCCAVNESARESLIRTMFKVERWAPWKDKQ
jgi:hypothetical protein